MLHFYNFIMYGITQLLLLPVWWYGSGLWLVLKRLGLNEYADIRRIGVHTWVTHLFVPMFHDYTVVGRGLSFVVRVFVIVFKTVQLVIGLLFRFLLLLLWVSLPLIMVWGFINFFVTL